VPIPLTHGEIIFPVVGTQIIGWNRCIELGYEYACFWIEFL